ncbi:WD40 repeat-like protein [Mycena venus]|uniref:WD40 repeat-like protein n=1 Tax=Mycena venus TaxID=2733690 RepID=A0A8H6YSE9_9AGAR|nr:WD40 repeat-like protein [Mycena venus]
MSDTTINALLSLDTKHSSAPVFFKLSCVLQWAPGKFARILHTSFGDYLTDLDRCGQEPWFIDPAFWGPQLTRSCLQVLNTELQFNICGLEDSHISNSAVHDLTDHIATYIPPHLSYSSCFWADHILGAEWDEVILADIENVMYNKFPFWLKILSILSDLRIGINALSHVGEVAKQWNIALAEFLTDALKFVIAFAPAFAHSAPHLYLSALPLTPTESHVAKMFSAWLVQKVDVHSSLGLGDQWPALQMTIKAHNNVVTTVAFSPGDGERLASGSWDTTVHVWDVRTGALIAAPLEGHAVRSPSVLRTVRHLMPLLAALEHGNHTRSPRRAPSKSGNHVTGTSLATRTMVSPLNRPPTLSSAAPEALFLAVLHQDDAHAWISLVSSSPFSPTPSAPPRHDEKTSPLAPGPYPRTRGRADGREAGYPSHDHACASHGTPANRGRPLVSTEPYLPNAPEYNQMAVPGAPNHSLGRLASPHLTSHQRRSVSRQRRPVSCQVCTPELAETTSVPWKRFAAAWRTWKRVLPVLPPYSYLIVHPSPSLSKPETGHLSHICPHLRHLISHTSFTGSFHTGPGVTIPGFLD